MNHAMLAKLAWRMLCCLEDPWCEALRSKYGVKDEDSAHLRLRQRSSQVWRGVVRGTELLRKGLKWKIENGEVAAFWKDI